MTAVVAINAANMACECAYLYYCFMLIDNIVIILGA
jgi:hypothetical protein